jgi:general secretion pathway protein D
LWLGACSLPSQQLSLPGPIEGPAKGSAIGSAANRGGAPLSGTAGYDSRPRAVEGTGEFTNPAAGPSAEPVARADANKDGVTLNLAGAGVPAVAKLVLGDTLGLNYSVHPDISGKITISTPQAIPKSDLYAVFQSLLRSQGMVILVEDGVHKIVPDSAAPIGLANRGQTAGLTSSVVKLRYVAPEEIERVLKALAPQSSIVSVDQNRNLLVVRGTPSELTSIRQTVQTFDVDWMRGMSIGIYPIESGDPEAVAKELDTVFANDRESPIKGVVRFVPNRRLKSVLVLTSQPAYLNKAAAWIQRIEYVGKAAEKKVHVYHVQTRPATELSRLLQQIYKPARGEDAEQASTPAENGGEQLSTQQRTNGGASGGAGDPRPQPVQIAPVQPVAGLGVGSATSTDQRPSSDIVTGSVGAASVPAATQFSDDRGGGVQIISDDANNALIITATAAEYRRMREILRRLDVAPNQVLLEATIAEVSLNDQLKFGLRWFFQKGRSDFSLTDSALGTIAPRFPGFSYFLDLPNVQVALNALSDVTDVNIVSSPSLMVLDNKLAVLQVGNEVPVATQSAVSVISPGAPIVNSISFRSTGVILRIRPRIGDSSRVLLEIEQEVSDVIPTTSSTIDSPTIQQRRIKTTVAVQSGQTIVLGGFMQDNASKRRQKMPLIGSVPVIGNLFKDKDDRLRRTELLIAITPNVVKDPNQLQGIAAEFRDRLNFTTRPQRRAPPDLREQIDRTLVK